ncbi:hypothetical protein CDAR_303121 [Caerostris darwini]|uniref:Uncharacterized protein n=1 Tax=Caerostris darwini TaxID=1538125 RepID=A0AAV4V435_9ARAC|nr:hypothetical protein CDAR_303121 [Caerostris darwini]
MRCKFRGVCVSGTSCPDKPECDRELSPGRSSGLLLFDLVFCHSRISVILFGSYQQHAFAKKDGDAHSLTPHGISNYQKAGKHYPFSSFLKHGHFNFLLPGCNMIFLCKEMR